MPQPLYQHILSGLLGQAFGILVLAEGDPLLCARYDATLSGDADTVSAMACAIAGTWRGAGAFPEQLIAELRCANPELDFEEVARGLTGMAEQNLGASE